MNLKYIAIGFVIAAMYYIIKFTVKKNQVSYMSHDFHDDEDIEVLAQSGRKISAIKAYRKLHRVSLREAKKAVEAMLTKGFHSSNHVDDELNISKDEEILRTAQSGHKIEAINIYREYYRVGLKEAKEAVESMLNNEN